MAYMKKWAKSKNVHVRRLASEGCRPRLPWSQQLKSFIDDPNPVLEILELLKLDEELYVRRSVANNLNDIAKDNPKIVIQTLTKWNKQHPKNDKIQWICHHALRTLIKKGNPNALRLIGFNPSAKVKVGKIKLKKQVIKIGEVQEFSFETVGGISFLVLDKNY